MGARHRSTRCSEEEDHKKTAILQFHYPDEGVHGKEAHWKKK